MEFRLIATIERNGRTATGGTPPPLVEAIVVHEERDELHLHCWTGPDDGTREWIRFRMSSGERLAPIVPAQAQRLVGVHAVLEVDALAVPNTGDTLVEWCIIRTVKRDRVVFEHDQSLLLLDSEGREKARWEFSNRWGDDRRRKLGVRTDWELADALRGSLTSKPDGCYLKDEKGELRLLVRIEKGADGKSTSLPVVEEQSPPPK